MALQTLLAVIRNTADEGSCTGACLNGAKAGLAAFLVLESIVIIPIANIISRRPNLVRFTALFAAGVFFSNALLHVLPEAAELLAGEEEEDDDHGDEEDETARILKATLRQPEDEGDTHGHDEGFPFAFFIVLVTFFVLVLVDIIFSPRKKGQLHSHGAIEDSASYADASSPAKSSKQDNSDVVVDVNPPTADGSPESATQPTPAKPSMVPVLVLGMTLALSVGLHTFVESAALGLSSSLGGALRGFAGIAAHRWAVSAALLSRLLQAVSAHLDDGEPAPKSNNIVAHIKRNWVAYVCFATFVVIAPISVVIGVAAREAPRQAQGVLSAIAAGSFLYLAGAEAGSVMGGGHGAGDGGKRGALINVAAAGVGALVIVIVQAILAAV